MPDEALGWHSSCLRKGMIQQKRLFNDDACLLLAQSYKIIVNLTNFKHRICLKGSNNIVYVFSYSRVDWLYRRGARREIASQAPIGLNVRNLSRRVDFRCFSWCAGFIGLTR